MLQSRVWFTVLLIIQAEIRQTLSIKGQTVLLGFAGQTLSVTTPQCAVVETKHP